MYQNSTFLKLPRIEVYPTARHLAGFGLKKAIMVATLKHRNLLLTSNHALFCFSVLQKKERNSSFRGTIPGG
jgi:hypothetical protein